MRSSTGPSRNSPETLKELHGRVLSKCPPVRPGDRWKDVWLWRGVVEVVSFKDQEEAKLPWPLVEVKLEDGRKGEVGLPAFIFGTRVKQGRRVPWKPKVAAPKKPSPPRVYLDRESK